MDTDESAPTRETREFWNAVARDWDAHVADEGDSNRMLNSDPVLWRLAGNVTGLTVLDAGCGPGYLARKLRDRGANVIAVDFSPRMCEIARAKAPEMDVRVDCCATLATVGDVSVDLVIANYVLMDVPDLEAATRAFYRVLKPRGAAVVVFSHPCFPQGSATVFADGARVEYGWDFPYFERRKCTDPPWGRFQSDFIWFHRPLSDYWKAFGSAGFRVVEFEEPRVDEANYHRANAMRKLAAYRSRPYSVAFKLLKERKVEPLV